MSAHAKLGPSAAKRWMRCTASVAELERLERQLGPEPSGEYAQAGTAKHEAAEYCLRRPNSLPEDTVGKVFEGYMIQEDDVEHFAQYVEMVRNLGKNADLLELETQVKVLDEVWGTADAIVIRDGTLFVIDLKTGYHEIEAEDNPQLMLYGLGAYLAYSPIWEINEICLIISQPRTGHQSLWNIGPEVLEKFHGEVLDAVKEVEEDPQFRPSAGACEWCRNRATCPALTEMVEEEAKQDFAQLELVDLQAAFEKLPLLESYIKGVKAGIMERLEKGHTVPGLKLVEGVRRRRWSDQDRAETYFSRRIPRWRENGYNHVMKSPTQIEKTLKEFKDDLHRPVTDRMLGELIEKAPGKPTITTVDDKRPALEYGAQAAADFDGVG